MDQFKKLISDYNFTLVGGITLQTKNSKNDDYWAPNFELYSNEQSTKEHGWVYLWCLSSASGSVQVCYVGKAGKTLKERCDGHVGGARPPPSGSITGKRNVDKMKKFLDDNSRNTINIYARKSDCGNVLGEIMCLCSIEEEAVINKCRRLGFNLWNK